MMLSIIIFILGISFILYAILGGADFGAGIIETFIGKKGEKTISKAIAPVWEANHVWLILAVVILFTGFPRVYSSLSLVLHIPLMLVLVGIIFRGSAFTFRHYDVGYGRSHAFYSFMFKSSSFITPMFLGITLGAMILGRITLNPGDGFYAMFIAPWFNWFCMFMGVFSTCLFAYVASVLLIPEAITKIERKRYVRIATRILVATVVSGLLVFVTAEWEGHALVNEFFNSPLSIGSMIIAAVAVPLILHFIHNNNVVYLRATIGVQVAAVIVGWFAIQYPVMINTSDGNHLTFYNTHAPQSTLQQLLIALIVGLVLVIPAFLFLFKVFKVREDK